MRIYHSCSQYIFVNYFQNIHICHGTSIFFHANTCIYAKKLEISAALTCVINTFLPHSAMSDILRYLLQHTCLHKHISHNTSKLHVVHHYILHLFYMAQTVSLKKFFFGITFAVKIMIKKTNSSSSPYYTEKMKLEKLRSIM